MKYKIGKGLAVGVICLLMLVTFPTVTGEDILYPRTDGPYTVFIFGECLGMGGGIFTFLHKFPLWFLIYPRSIRYHFNESSVFFVNGEKQDIVYPALIELSGFKGYGTTFYMMELKETLAYFIGALKGFTPRARVIGRCTEILVEDAR